MPYGIARAGPMPEEGVGLAAGKGLLIRNNLEKGWDAVMLTKEEILQIAKQVDPKADVISVYPKGYHFMRKEDEYKVSDPGFAVSKEDGRVYMGFSSRIFLVDDLFEKEWNPNE